MLCLETALGLSRLFITTSAPNIHCLNTIGMQVIPKGGVRMSSVFRRMSSSFRKPGFSSHFYRLLDSTVEKCGECCLVHEKFSLNLIKEATDEPRTDTIFKASEFQGCSSVQIGTAQSSSRFPFGSIFVRNFSEVPVNFTVFGDTEEETDMTVQPFSEAAVTLNAISAVQVFHPTDPVRLLFVFDIFHPVDPIIPSNP